MKTKTAKIIGFLFIAATIFFLGKAIFRNWEVIKNQPFHFDIQFLLLSAVSAFSMYVFWSLLWQSILRQLDYHVPLKKILSIYIMTQPLKYIPGKIAIFLARSSFIKKHGIPLSIGMYSSFIEVFYGLMASMLLGTFGLSFFLKNTALAMTIAFSTVFVGFILLLPSIFYAITAWLFRLFKHQEIPRKKRATFIAAYRSFLFALFGVVAFAATHFFFLRSLTDISFNHFFSFVSIAAFTFFMGMVVFVSPSGIGVREGMFYLFLTPILGVPLTLTFTATSRLWTIVYDFLFLIFVFIGKKSGIVGANEN